MTDQVPLAATVVLLRDGPAGAEVLLLERPHDRGSFAGAWVFPGGSVDPEDDDDDGSGAGADADAAEEWALRRAAVRETLEETGLAIRPESLVPFSRWHPPLEAQKRLLTSFFVAAAPPGDVVLAAHESVASVWLRPADALGRHAEGSLLLYPPTWVTLHGFLDAGSVAEVLRTAAGRGPEEFRTRFTADRAAVLWEGDGAYADDGALDASGPRHRLTVGPLPWTYERSSATRTS